MKKTTPAHANVVVLKQILNLIPLGLLIISYASETGVDAMARSFSVVSHLYAMLFAQLSHSIGLNDVCDWLRLKSPVLSRSGVTPPSRNALSHANKNRNADFAAKLFWSVLDHLQHMSPGFAAGRKGEGLLRRFKVRTHAVESTVIQLVANCMDWAKHRRCKAAAKMHLRLDLHSFLPSFAIMDTAGQHDNKRAREVCVGIAPGEIVVFDKAYVDFDHLFDLNQRGVWWVTRAKDNMKFRIVKNHTKGHENIIKDQIIGDGAGFHHKGKEAGLPGTVRIITLPAYSPEPNPAEKLRDIAKHGVCNCDWKDLAELEEEIIERIRPYWEDTKRVTSLIGNGYLLSELNAI